MVFKKGGGHHGGTRHSDPPPPKGAAAAAASSPSHPSDAAAAHAQAKAARKAAKAMARSAAQAAKEAAKQIMQAARSGHARIGGAADATRVQLAPLLLERHNDALMSLFLCQCSTSPAHVVQHPVLLPCACVISSACLLRGVERQLDPDEDDEEAQRPAASDTTHPCARCPNKDCRMDVSADVIEWQPNVGLQQQLSKQRVRCPQHADGCEFEGVLGMEAAGLRAHLAQCPFEREACKACQQMVPRARMQQHLMEWVPCPYGCVDDDPTAEFWSAAGVEAYTNPQLSRKRALAAAAAAAAAAGAAAQQSTDAAMVTTAEQAGAGEQAPILPQAEALDANPISRTSANLPAAAAAAVAAATTPVRTFRACHLAVHVAACENRPINCSACSVQFPAHKLASHEAELTHKFAVIQAQLVAEKGKVRALEGKLAAAASSSSSGSGTKGRRSEEVAAVSASATTALVDFDVSIAPMSTTTSNSASAAPASTMHALWDAASALPSATTPGGAVGPGLSSLSMSSSSLSSPALSSPASSSAAPMLMTTPMSAAAASASSSLKSPWDRGFSRGAAAVAAAVRRAAAQMLPRANAPPEPTILSTAAALAAVASFAPTALGAASVSALASPTAAAAASNAADASMSDVAPPMDDQEQREREADQDDIDSSSTPSSSSSSSLSDSDADSLSHPRPRQSTGGKAQVVPFTQLRGPVARMVWPGGNVIYVYTHKGAYIFDSAPVCSTLRTLGVYNFPLPAYVMSWYVTHTSLPRSSYVVVSRIPYDGQHRAGRRIWLYADAVGALLSLRHLEYSASAASDSAPTQTQLNGVTELKQRMQRFGAEGGPEPDEAERAEAAEALEAARVKGRGGEDSSSDDAGSGSEQDDGSSSDESDVQPRASRRLSDAAKAAQASLRAKERRQRTEKLEAARAQSSSATKKGTRRASTGSNAAPSAVSRPSRSSSASDDDGDSSSSFSSSPRFSTPINFSSLKAVAYTPRIQWKGQDLLVFSRTLSAKGKSKGKGKEDGAAATADAFLFDSAPVIYALRAYDMARVGSSTVTQPPSKLLRWYRNSPSSGSYRLRHSDSVQVRSIPPLSQSAPLTDRKHHTRNFITPRALLALLSLRHMQVPTEAQRRQAQTMAQSVEKFVEQVGGSKLSLSTSKAEKKTGKEKGRDREGGRKRARSSSPKRAISSAEEEEGEQSQPVVNRRRRRSSSAASASATEEAPKKKKQRRRSSSQREGASSSASSAGSDSDSGVSPLDVRFDQLEGPLPCPLRWHGTALTVYALQVRGRRRVRGGGHVRRRSHRELFFDSRPLCSMMRARGMSHVAQTPSKLVRWYVRQGLLRPGDALAVERTPYEPTPASIAAAAAATAAGEPVWIKSHTCTFFSLKALKALLSLEHLSHSLESAVPIPPTRTREMRKDAQELLARITEFVASTNPRTTSRKDSSSSERDPSDSSDGSGNDSDPAGPPGAGAPTATDRFAKARAAKKAKADAAKAAAAKEAAEAAAAAAKEAHERAAAAVARRHSAPPTSTAAFASSSAASPAAASPAAASSSTPSSSSSSSSATAVPLLDLRDLQPVACDLVWQDSPLKTYAYGQQLLWDMRPLITAWNPLFLLRSPFDLVKRVKDSAAAAAAAAAAAPAAPSDPSAPLAPAAPTPLSDLQSFLVRLGGSSRGPGPVPAGAGGKVTFVNTAMLQAILARFRPGARAGEADIDRMKRDVQQAMDKFERTRG